MCSSDLGKSVVRAADMATGRPIPTDSITLEGKPFPYVPPDQPYKHLGVRATLLGDFSAEKQHVRQEMQRRLAALREDRALSSREKEVVIVTAVCSVFRYSAGLVDWTRSELEDISRIWARAYAAAWTLPHSSDRSPFILTRTSGGRGCPSALELWIRSVLDILDQCLSLPGEISLLVTRHLQRQCSACCCLSLNQLQLMLRLEGSSGSVLELLLQRLDEAGLEISSPWQPVDEISIAESLWPRLHAAWSGKEQWLGCTELDETVQEAWNSAVLCVRACRKLGSVEPPICTLSDLRAAQGLWQSRADINRRGGQLTEAEYSVLVSWLPRPTLASRPSASLRPAVQYVPWEEKGEDRALFHIPPCIAGTVSATSTAGRLALQPEPWSADADGEISQVSTTDLAMHLCRYRAIFLLPLNDHQSLSVECLVPLRALAVMSSR